MTKEDATQEVVDAAREVLNNLIDSGAFGPDLESDNNSYKRDKEGDPWYDDTWRLRQALEQYDKLNA